MFLFHLKSAWGGIHPRWVILSTNHAGVWGALMHLHFFEPANDPTSFCANIGRGGEHRQKALVSPGTPLPKDCHSASQSNYDIKNDFIAYRSRREGFRRSSSSLFCRGMHTADNSSDTVKRRRGCLNRSDKNGDSFIKCEDKVASRRGIRNLILFFLSIVPEG